MDIQARKKRILIRAIERDLPLARIAREAGVTRAAVYHIMFNRNETAWLRRLLCERLGFKPSELGWPDDIMAA